MPLTNPNTTNGLLQAILTQLNNGIVVSEGFDVLNGSAYVGGTNKGAIIAGYDSGNAVLRFLASDLNGLLQVAAGTTPLITYAATRFRSLTVNSTAQAIKASAGNLYGWNIVNLTGGIIYVKIYNIAAGSVNPASDAPIKTLQIPANGSVYAEPNCIKAGCSTAISVRAVTGSGDTDTTAPGTLPIIEIDYA